MTSKITTPLRPLRLLACASIVGLGLSGCSSDAEGEPEPSETVTVTADPSESEPTESESAESSEDPSEDPSESADAGETPATEAFTSQGGTFTFEIPEGWTAETTEYNAGVVQTNGVPHELVLISSPLGDIEIYARLHAGAIDGDGWSAQHWQTVDVEELDLPVRADDEHVYLSSGAQWLGEQDEDIDREAMGWDAGDYRLVTSVTSTTGDVAVGDDEKFGWAYLSPLSGNYEGITNIIFVHFSQELMEYLTGESGREDTITAFLDNEWYQTTTDILRSIEYREPAAEDLPFTE